MNPILFRYGGFALHYSHVIFLGAFLMAYQLSHYRATKLGIASADWERALAYYGIGAVVGGRLSYIFGNLELFLGRWREALTVWHGAFSLWGALLGFLLAALVLRKRRSFSLQGLDIIAIVFPLFLGMSQLGRFTEGEGWGRVGHGIFALEHSGMERYPIWLGFFIWYLLTALVLSLRPVRWKGEHFVLMVGSMALAAVGLAPWSLLPGTEGIIQYTWGVVFLLIAVIIWSSRRAKYVGTQK